MSVTPLSWGNELAVTANVNGWPVDLIKDITGRLEALPDSDDDFPPPSFWRSATMLLGRVAGSQPGAVKLLNLWGGRSTTGSAIGDALNEAVDDLVDDNIDAVIKGVKGGLTAGATTAAQIAGAGAGAAVAVGGVPIAEAAKAVQGVAQAASNVADKADKNAGKLSVMGIGALLLLGFVAVKAGKYV